MSEQTAETTNGAHVDNGANTASFTQEFEVAGGKLVDFVKNLIAEGNARHIIIRQSNGAKLLELPLTWGVGVGGVLMLGASWLLVLAIIAAVVAKVKVEVVMDPDRKTANAEPMDVPIDRDNA